MQPQPPPITMHTHSINKHTHTVHITHIYIILASILTLHYTTDSLHFLGINRASIKTCRRPVLALHPCQSSMQAQIGWTQADSLCTVLISSPSHNLHSEPTCNTYVHYNTHIHYSVTIKWSCKHYTSKNSLY